MSKKVMETSTIEMAALGRALHPGTLYDCRTDSLIPGISLWDTETIKTGLDSCRQPKTELNFSASNSLSEKAKLLEVGASLKASFLCGLVEVEGSARYMRDDKSSASESRVSMQYGQTTRFDRLTMDQLANITYPEVFQECPATHVVTAALYGGQAFMVFYLTANEIEEKEEIEGQLHVMVQQIPALSVEGGGGLTMSQAEKKLASDIKCTFYGDYELQQNPTTYLEALDVYKKLPSQLREKANDAVPMKVWLYPLAYLNDKAATLQCEIHSTLITKAENILEDLRNAESQCNDWITNKTINDFQEVKLRLQSFQDFLQVYKVMFLKALRRVIPEIRSGTMKEQTLADIITLHHKSPFRAAKLNQWLEYSQGEVNLLTLYTQQLTGIPVVKYTALNNIIFDPNVDTVLCFCFTSLTDKDPYLSMLDEMLQENVFEKLSTIVQLADQDIKPWFQRSEVIDNMKDKLFRFKSIFQANKDNPKTRFVIVPVADPSSPGNSIRLYKNCKLVDSTFQPVSKPPAPKVEVQDRNVMMKLQKSPTGSTVRFRVEYRIVKATDSQADEEKWEVRETPDDQEAFTLTGLQLTKQYRIRYRAVSEAGVSEASDSVLLSAHGKFKASLSERWDWLSCTFINEIRHKMLSSLGTSRRGSSTINPSVKWFPRKPKIPYEHFLCSGSRMNIAFHFQGVIPEDSVSFTIDFKPTKGDDVDIALRLKLYPGHGAVSEIRVDGNWDKKSFIRGCPLIKGSEFDLIITAGDEHYVVYLNGWRYSVHEHHIQLEKEILLQIDGDVILKTTGVSELKNWATIYDNNQNVGTSRYELSKDQADGAQPFCKPNQPYLGHIPGGLKPGLTFFFQGVVPSDAKGFAINFRIGPTPADDIAFHFNPRLHSVVCNHATNQKYQAEETVHEKIFAQGEGFDIIIIIKPNRYEVTVNGRELCTFQHYIPLERVNTLQIFGDVLMNTCALIHVNTINLTGDFSAHI